MNTEPTNESAYRGGELTQLRRERELYQAQVVLLELQVAQLQHQLDQVRTIRKLRDPWNDFTVLQAVILAGFSVCLGILVGKLLQVVS